jgi:hypothetical protein
MSIEQAFHDWRAARNGAQGWGLAWYLAWHVCKRFYASHGIVPLVINKEGLGYYGLELAALPCPVNAGKAASLGRLTMAGNVENWVTGSPGDHGLKTAEMCDGDAPADELVSLTIQHLRLPVMPRKSHLGCRHQRWGASYVLLFEIMTLLALRHGEQVRIANHPADIGRILDALDPEAGIKEHPGGFVVESGETRTVIAGDGRVLSTPGENLWHRYMAGESADALANHLAELHRLTN